MTCFLKFVIYGLITLGVILADKFNPFIGATLSSFLAFFLIKKLTTLWLQGLAKYSRHRRRKFVAFPSGYILPWLEWCSGFLQSNSKTESKHHLESLGADHSLQVDSLNYSQENDVFLVQEIKNCGLQPSASEEAKIFVLNISREYIHPWYIKISDHEEFVRDLDYALEDVLVVTCDKLAKIKINQLAHRCLILIFNHLQYHKNGSEQNFTLSHHALKDHKSDFIYMLKVCEILLDLVGPSEVLNCSVVRTILVDILTKKLWLPLIELLSSPRWVLWTLTFLLGDAEAVENAHYLKEALPGFSRVDSASSSSTNKVQRSVPKLVVSSVGTSQPDSSHNSIPGYLSKRKSVSYTSLFQVEPDQDLSKVKSIDHQSSDEEIRLNFLPVLSREHNYCYSAENLYSTPQGEVNLLFKRKLSEGAQQEGSSGEYAGELYKAIPPFSLFPVKGQNHRKQVLGNRYSVPSPMFNRLPKKSKTQKKIKCSLSLDAINGTGLQVHQSGPSSQTLCPSILSSVFQLPTIAQTITSTKTENKPNSHMNSGYNIITTSEQDLLSTPDVEEAREVTEITHLESFFNVFIKGTREQLDPKKQTYILYCIECNYLDTETLENGEHQFVKRTSYANRRFKEFIALQSKLESAKSKKEMKGIVGPTKWLSMTISPKDKKSIEKRRIFLENYLQLLCRREAIAVNEDLHEFLGFKGDPGIAFVQKMNLPGTKMFEKAVIGAFNLFKTAIPSLPLENGIEDISHLMAEKVQTPSRSLLPNFGKTKPEIKLPYLEFNCRKPSSLEQDISHFIDRFDDLSSSPENSRPSSPYNYSLAGEAISDRNLMPSTSIPAWRKIASKLDGSAMGPRSRGDGCDSPDGKIQIKEHFLKFQNLQDSLEKDIPLANTLTDIVLSSFFSKHSMSDDYATVAFKVLLGDLVQRWFQKLLRRLTSPEKCAHYLHLLHTSLWPSTPKQEKSLLGIEEYRKAASKVIKDSFSWKVKFLLGEATINENVEIFLDSLLSPMYNKNLLYQIIDVIIDVLCAQDLERVRL